MASALSSLFGSPASSGAASNPSAASSSSTTAGSTGNTAPSEEMFLQLLVSQIQNQDPLNPADSTQFVSQLAQFSELEQVVAIRGDIETAMSSSAQQNATNPATPTDPATPTNNLTPSVGSSSNSATSTT
jgi:flagellar basal-body rod modification protein FlgD